MQHGGQFTVFNEKFLQIRKIRKNGSIKRLWPNKTTYFLLSISFTKFHSELNGTLLKQQKRHVLLRARETRRHSVFQYPKKNKVRMYLNIKLQIVSYFKMQHSNLLIQYQPTAHVKHSSTYQMLSQMCGVNLVVYNIYTLINNL